MQAQKRQAAEDSRMAECTLKPELVPQAKYAEVQPKLKVGAACLWLGVLPQNEAQRPVPAGSPCTGACAAGVRF